MLKLAQFLDKLVYKTFQLHTFDKIKGNHHFHKYNFIHYHKQVLMSHSTFGNRNKDQNKFQKLHENGGIYLSRTVPMDFKNKDYLCRTKKSHLIKRHFSSMK